MPKYVVLMNLTEGGAEALTADENKAKAFADELRQEFKDQQATLETLLWTTGEYDAVAVAEAPDDQKMAALVLAMARDGGVRTKTLTAYGDQEMGQIVGHLRGGHLRGGHLRGGHLRGGSADD